MRMPLMGFSELNSLVYSLYIVPYTTVFVVSLLVFRKAIKKTGNVTFLGWNVYI